MDGSSSHAVSWRSRSSCCVMRFDLPSPRGALVRPNRAQLAAPGWPDGAATSRYRAGSEGCGGVRQRQAQVVVKDDDRAVLGIEVAYATLQVIPVGCSRLVVGHGKGKDLGKLDLDAPTLGGPELAAAGVEEDPVQPCVESIGVAQRGQVPPATDRSSPGRRPSPGRGPGGSAGQRRPVGRSWRLPARRRRHDRPSALAPRGPVAHPPSAGCAAGLVASGAYGGMRLRIVPESRDPGDVPGSRRSEPRDVRASARPPRTTGPAATVRRPAASFRYASCRITGGLLPSTMTKPRWNGTVDEESLVSTIGGSSGICRIRTLASRVPSGDHSGGAPHPSPSSVSSRSLLPVGVDQPRANRAGPAVDILRRVHRAVEGELLAVG